MDATPFRFMSYTCIGSELLKIRFLWFLSYVLLFIASSSIIVCLLLIIYTCSISSIDWPLLQFFMISFMHAVWLRIDYPA